MKLSNKSKVSTALILSTFTGIMLHPSNTVVTNMLAFIPCIAACYIIAPLIKKKEEIMTANDIIRYMKYRVLLNTLDVPVKVDGKGVTNIELVGNNEDGNFYFNLKTD